MNLALEIPADDAFQTLLHNKKHDIGDEVEKKVDDYLILGLDDKFKEKVNAEKIENLLDDEKKLVYPSKRRAGGL